MFNILCFLKYRLICQLVRSPITEHKHSCEKFLFLIFFMKPSNLANRKKDLVSIQVPLTPDVEIWQMIYSTD